MDAVEDKIPERLLQVRVHDGPGYLPLVDYERWRVAVLNFCPELRPQALGSLQRHDLTDEVFVLLRGRCLLFVADGADGADAAVAIHACDLRPGVVYNVVRGTWHTHALTPDAMVLVVENRDTTRENSPVLGLGEDERRRLRELAAAAWEGLQE